MTTTTTAMAAESSTTTTTRARATTPSVDSYVGSLISLISNSEIRYQGILLNINTTQSSIGLRHVKSFGTERRRKNGPQVPPSDKVYEYILFRGSDIKDLQVKSAPPVQTTATVFNDPAIIQSHYPQEAATSMSTTPAVTRSQQDLSSYSMVVPHQSTPQSSLPLYQPGGSSGSWSTSYPYPTLNGSVPNDMYMQGFYRASDGIQTQQQSLLQPPPGLLVRPFIQQTMQYPASSASLSTRSFNLPDSAALDTTHPLLPSFSASTLHLHSSLLPAQSSALPSDSLSISMSNTAPIQSLHPAAITTSLQLVNPLTNVLDKNFFAPYGAVQPKIADSMISYNSIFESEHHVMDKSNSFLHNGLAPPLVTPNQFLQPRSTIVSSSQSLQAIQNDVVVVPVSSIEQPIQNFPDTLSPILPLPTPLDYKVCGDPAQSHHQISRGGRGRARDHWSSDNVLNFTEEFDFVAMNEKFNKDEIWGHLGKANTTEEDGYPIDRDNGISNFETKPVYVKDDFFDSLSSNTSGGVSHNGRSAFSERRKLNTETFGNFSRHRGGRGFGHSSRGFDRAGRGFGHSGHGFVSGDHGFEGDGYGNSRGGYGYGRSGRGSHSGGANYGRGYGYNERGGWGNHGT